jgi:hypothetical protein
MSSKALRFIAWGLLAVGFVDGLSPRGLSPAAAWLAALIAWLAVLAWLRRDAVDRRFALPYDWPWLMTIGWPISWLWYSRRTRRRWLTAFGLASLPIAFLLGGLLAHLAAGLMG